MPTTKQLPPNRAKAQKNAGPLTPAAGSESGLDFAALIIPGETAEELAQLSAEHLEKFRPADTIERFFVDTLIYNEWRLRRMRQVEAGLWQLASNNSPGDDMKLSIRRPGASFTNFAAALERLQRIVDGCQRNYRRALKELSSLQRARLREMRTSQPERPALRSASQSPSTQGAKPLESAIHAVKRAKKNPETIEAFDASFQTILKQ